MISKFKIVLLLLSTCYFLLATFYITPIYAQTACGSIVNPRAEGLVTTPRFEPGSKFGTTGSCVIDLKVGFDTYKIPSFLDLRSRYFDQIKPSTIIFKHDPLINTGTNKTQSDLTATACGDELYDVDTNLDIKEPLSGNQTKVVFVNGDLNIGPLSSNKLIYPSAGGDSNTGLVLVAKGNVYIDQAITELDAVIISEGTICTAADFTNGSPTCPSQNIPLSQLTIKGSLISLNESKPISFRRSLINNNQPAEQINHQVKYLVILRNLFSDTPQRWSELGANEVVPQPASANTSTIPISGNTTATCSPACIQDSAGNWIQNSYRDIASCGLRLCDFPPAINCTSFDSSCHGDIYGYNGASCNPTASRCPSNASTYTSSFGQIQVCGDNNIYACTAPTDPSITMDTSVNPNRRQYFTGGSAGSACTKATCNFPYSPPPGQQLSICGTRTTTVSTNITNDSQGCKRADGATASQPDPTNIFGRYYPGDQCSQLNCNPNPADSCSFYNNSCHGDIIMFNGLDCTNNQTICPGNYATFNNFSTQTQANICGASNINSCSGGSLRSFSPGSNTSNAISPTNLVGYWNFDDGAGSYLSDLSGYGNVGNLINSPSWNTTGVFGKALNFNSTSSVVSLTNSISLNGLSYTISAWVNFPLPTTAGGWRTLTRGSGNDHQVIINSTGLLGVYDNAGGTGFRSSGYNISGLSGWHLLSAIASGTTTSFYIDTSLVGQSPFKSNAQISYIGNYQGGGQNFGLIDEMKIYTRAISATEVSSLYNATVSSTSSCGTVSCQYPYYPSGNHNSVCGVAADSTHDSAGCSNSGSGTPSIGNLKTYYSGSSCTASTSCKYNPRPACDNTSCHDAIYGYDGSSCNNNVKICDANYTSFSGFSSVSQSSVCGANNTTACNANGTLKTYDAGTSCNTGSGTCSYPYYPPPGQQTSICGTRTGTSPNYHDSNGCSSIGGTLNTYYPGDSCSQSNCYPNPAGSCVSSCHADNYNVHSGVATGNICGTQTCYSNLPSYASTYSQFNVCGGSNINACASSTDANITFSGSLRQYYNGGSTGATCNKSTCDYPYGPSGNHDSICGADNSSACVNSTTLKQYYPGNQCSPTNCGFPPARTCPTNSCHGDIYGYNGTDCSTNHLICSSNAGSYANHNSICGTNNEYACDGSGNRKTYYTGTATNEACNTALCDFHSPTSCPTGGCTNTCNSTDCGTQAVSWSGTSCNATTCSITSTSNSCPGGNTTTCYEGANQYYHDNTCTSILCPHNYYTEACASCVDTAYYAWNGDSCTTKNKLCGISNVPGSTCTTGTGDCPSSVCHGANDASYRCYTGSACAKTGYCPSTISNNYTYNVSPPACRKDAYPYNDGTFCGYDTTSYPANCGSFCNNDGVGCYQSSIMNQITYAPISQCADCYNTNFQFVLNYTDTWINKSTGATYTTAYNPWASIYRGRIDYVDENDCSNQYNYVCLASSIETAIDNTYRADGYPRTRQANTAASHYYGPVNQSCPAGDYQTYYGWIYCHNNSNGY